MDENDSACAGVLGLNIDIMQKSGKQICAYILKSPVIP
jgi:hypothetical protein